MGRHYALMLAVAVLAAVAGGWVRQQTATVDATRPLPLPALTLPDLAGRPHALAEWRGQVLVINFWATWCPPCVEEVAELMAVQRAYGHRGVQVIGIAVDNAAAVADFKARHPIGYPVLVAGDGGLALARQFGNQVDAVPFTVIVNRSGQMVYRHPGALDNARLERAIAPLLAAPGG